MEKKSLGVERGPFTCYQQSNESKDADVAVGLVDGPIEFEVEAACGFRKDAATSVAACAATAGAATKRHPISTAGGKVVINEGDDFGQLGELAAAIRFCDDDDEEIFFGEVTDKEAQKAAKYHHRKTAAFQPEFRQDRRLMRYTMDCNALEHLIEEESEEEIERSDPALVNDIEASLSNLSFKAEHKMPNEEKVVLNAIKQDLCVICEPESDHVSGLKNTDNSPEQVKRKVQSPYSAFVSKINGDVQSTCPGAELDVYRIIHLEDISTDGESFCTTENDHPAVKDDTEIAYTAANGKSPIRDGVHVEQDPVRARESPDLVLVPKAASPVPGNGTQKTECASSAEMRKAITTSRPGCCITRNDVVPAENGCIRIELQTETPKNSLKVHLKCADEAMSTNNGIQSDMADLWQRDSQTKVPTYVDCDSASHRRVASTLSGFLSQNMTMDSPEKTTTVDNTADSMNVELSTNCHDISISEDKAASVNVKTVLSRIQADWEESRSVNKSAGLFIESSCENASELSTPSKGAGTAQTPRTVVKAETVSAIPHHIAMSTPIPFHASASHQSAFSAYITPIKAELSVTVRDTTHSSVGGLPMETGCPAGLSLGNACCIGSLCGEVQTVGRLSDVEAGKEFIHESEALFKTAQPVKTKMEMTAADGASPLAICVVPDDPGGHPLVSSEQALEHEAQQSEEDSELVLKSAGLSAKHSQQTLKEDSKIEFPVPAEKLESKLVDTTSTPLKTTLYKTFSLAQESGIQGDSGPCTKTFGSLAPGTDSRMKSSPNNSASIWVTERRFSPNVNRTPASPSPQTVERNLSELKDSDVVVFKEAGFSPTVLLLETLETKTGPRNTNIVTVPAVSVDKLLTEDLQDDKAETISAVPPDALASSRLQQKPPTKPPIAHPTASPSPNLTRSRSGQKAAIKTVRNLSNSDAGLENFSTSTSESKVKSFSRLTSKAVSFKPAGKPATPTVQSHSKKSVKTAGMPKPPAGISNSKPTLTAKATPRSRPTLSTKEPRLLPDSRPTSVSNATQVPTFSPARKCTPLTLKGTQGSSKTKTPLDGPQPKTAAQKTKLCLFKSDTPKPPSGQKKEQSTPSTSLSKLKRAAPLKFDWDVNAPAAKSPATVSMIEEKRFALERVREEKRQVQEKLIEMSPLRPFSPIPTRSPLTPRSPLTYQTSADNLPRVRYRDTQSSQTLQLSETELEAVTKIHTLCNSQQVSRIVTKARAAGSPAATRHKVVSKDPSRLQWQEELIATSDITYSPCETPTPTKSILNLRGTDIFPFNAEAPSPVVIRKLAKRTNTLCPSKM